MHLERRKLLAGIGTATAALGLGASTTVLADTHAEVLRFSDWAFDDEYVVIENTGDSEINLGGYYIDWDNDGEYTITNQFDSDVSIEADGTLKIATGWGDVPNADIDYERDSAELEDEGDVIAILEPDEETVVIQQEIGGNTEPPEDGSDDSDDTDGDDTPDGREDDNIEDSDDGDLQDDGDADDGMDDDDTDGDGDDGDGADDDGTDGTDEAGDDTDGTDDAGDDTDDDTDDDDGADGDDAAAEPEDDEDC